MAIVLINTVIFLFLSGMHVYWAFGGRRGWESSIPSTLAGDRIINPGFLSSILVATGLLLFAVITVSNSGSFTFGPASQLFYRIGNWVIIVLFALRAMGDFNIVGFFKKIRGTEFARYDTFLYSPLCLYLSLSTLLLMANR